MSSVVEKVEKDFETKVESEWWEYNGDEYYSSLVSYNGRVLQISLDYNITKQELEICHSHINSGDINKTLKNPNFKVSEFNYMKMMYAITDYCQNKFIVDSDFKEFISEIHRIINEIDNSVNYESLNY